MINFVSTSPNNLKKYGGGSEYIGYLGTPRTMHNIPDGMSFALDNDCFNFYDPGAIINMLKKYSGISNRCQFAVVPDSVGNATRTTMLFNMWHPVYWRYGFKCAYVLQNGVTLDMIPFDRISALFIGGDDKFKLSGYTADIVNVSKQHRVWVHMGRVNSVIRIRYAQSIGCDSFDGTQFSRFSKAYIKKFLPYHSNYQHSFMELVS